jgi:hypothetical protein
MNYEQEKHKINNLVKKSNFLSIKLDKAEYTANSLNTEHFIKKITYIETDWEQNFY